MRRVLLPADGQPRDNVPKGAALVELGPGQAICYFSRADAFAERCAQASKGHGQLIHIDFETVRVGVYDERDGELRPGHGDAIAQMKAWLGAACVPQ